MKMKSKDKKAAREQCKDLFTQQAALKKQIAELRAKENETIAARSKALFIVGNLIHESVPVSDTEVCMSADWPLVSVTVLCPCLSLSPTILHVGNVWPFLYS